MVGNPVRSRRQWSISGFPVNVRANCFDGLLSTQPVPFGLLYRIGCLEPAQLFRTDLRDLRDEVGELDSSRNFRTQTGPTQRRPSSFPLSRSPSDQTERGRRADYPADTRGKLLLLHRCSYRNRAAPSDSRMG